MIKEAYELGREEALEKLGMHPITAGLATGLGTVGLLALLMGKQGRKQVREEVTDPQLYKNLGTTFAPALGAGGAALKFIEGKKKYPLALASAIAAGTVGKEINKSLFLNDYRKEKGLPPLEGWFV